MEIRYKKPDSTKKKKSYQSILHRHVQKSWKINGKKRGEHKNKKSEKTKKKNFGNNKSKRKNNRKKYEKIEAKIRTHHPTMQEKPKIDFEHQTLKNPQKTNKTTEKATKTEEEKNLRDNAVNESKTTTNPKNPKKFQNQNLGFYSGGKIFYHIPTKKKYPFNITCVY